MAPPSLVKTIDEFVANLKCYFKYDKWSNYINFDKFQLAGGSVVLCMLRAFDQPITSDLDFFYIGSDDADFFDSLVSNLFFLLSTTSS